MLHFSRSILSRGGMQTDGTHSQVERGSEKNWGFYRTSKNICFTVSFNACISFLQTSNTASASRSK